MNDDLESAGARLRRSRASLDKAVEVAREAAMRALAEGHAEAAVARALGVDRMTVRKWAGKR